MALVRLLCFQSTSQLCTQQILSFNQATPLLSLPKPPPFRNTPISHLPPLPLSTPQFPLSHIKTQKPNPFVFSVSIETPLLAESEAGVEEEEEEDDASQTRLLAQNVPWTSTADDLRPLFEKYGTVVDIELSMHKKTRNRGLAFVTMGSHEEALAALTNLESYEFEGRDLKLTWAKPKKKKTYPVVQRKPAPIHNLFVANLPYQARAKDLKEFFNSENGNVVSAEIIFHENPRRSAGYGFVSFNTKQEAEAALATFQAKMFMERPIRVARSRRFLRQHTKADIELEKASAKLSSNGEQSEESELA